MNCLKYTPSFPVCQLVCSKKLNYFYLALEL
nr:MAG TPA: hypothetical protein [Caudoviricetes sp.]